MALISPAGRAPQAEVLTRPQLKIKSSQHSLGYQSYSEPLLCHLFSKFMDEKKADCHNKMNYSKVPTLLDHVATDGSSVVLPLLWALCSVIYELVASLIASCARGRRWDCHCLCFITAVLRIWRSHEANLDWTAALGCFHTHMRTHRWCRGRATCQNDTLFHFSACTFHINTRLFPHSWRRGLTGRMSCSHDD